MKTKYLDRFLEKSAETHPANPAKPPDDPPERAESPGCNPPFSLGTSGDDPTKPTKPPPGFPLGNGLPVPPTSTPPPPDLAAAPEGEEPAPAAEIAPSVPWPPRPAEIGDWPIPWRQAWADRAERLQQGGADWRDAERTAYAEIQAERAAGKPPPGPDPAVRDRLRAECEAHRHELPGPLRGQPTAPDDPLLAWLDRGVTREQLEPRPLSGDRSEFECQNPYCLNKGRWWRSIYGVTRCWNCRPPAFSELVAEVGETPR